MRPSDLATVIMGFLVFAAPTAVQAAAKYTPKTDTLPDEYSLIFYDVAGKKIATYLACEGSIALFTADGAANFSMPLPSTSNEFMKGYINKFTALVASNYKVVKEPINFEEKRNQFLDKVIEILKNGDRHAL